MELSLVVPCTKRKRRSKDSTVNFHDLPVLPPGPLAKEWLRSGAGIPVVAARNLYCGAGWTTALGAFEEAQRLADTQLRVISAGYGLIAQDQPLPPYNATFASETDQIGRRVELPGSLSQRHSAWWSAINSARNLSEHPLADTLYESAHVMVAVGSTYLSAIQNDLIQLQKRIGPKRLWIVCAGTPNIPALEPSILSLSSKMEYALTGTRSTLSQRIAEWLLREVVPETGWERTQIERRILQTELEAHRHGAKTIRDKMTDSEVILWITTQLSTGSQKSISRLLADYREKGLACGANRFRRLFDYIGNQTNELVEASAEI